MAKLKLTWFTTIILLVAFPYACDDTSQEAILSGILEVPENRNEANSRSLKLAYKVLKAKKPDALKAPIVYLQGGPGMPTLITEPFWTDHPLREDRDIVLMDQRGTGKSSAFCNSMAASLHTLGAADYSEEQHRDALVNLFTICKKEIHQKGIDLQGYNSREIAADFEDLRLTLGYEQWNLYGASYGSRLGFTMMLDFPESIRSAILMGVSPPGFNTLSGWVVNLERSLMKVFKECEKNTNCNDLYPNLKDRLRNVLTIMQNEPLHFAYKGKPFVLNAYEAIGLLFDLLYDRNSIGHIPRFIEALEKAETQPIVERIGSFEPIYQVLNFAMGYSVIAYDDFPLYNRSNLELAISQAEFGFAMTFYLSEYEKRENWHPYRAFAFENQPVVSNIPTLLLSGALDPVSPPSNATEALRYLRNGYEVVFANESHDFISNSCFASITEEFINNPFQKPNSACRADRGPIEWNLSRP